MNTNRLFIVDVEAAGASPATGTMTEFGVVDVATREWFHGGLWAFTPDPVIPAIPVPTHVDPTVNQGLSKFDMDAGPGHPVDAAVDVLKVLTSWMESHAQGGRITLVSDNPGYDFMWMAAAYDAEGLANPFGHSSRRIGDYAAGLLHSWRESSSWKSLRDVSHSHRPHEDAQGNAGALIALQRLEAELAGSDPHHRARAKTTLKKFKNKD